MNTQLIVLLAGRDNATSRFIQQRLPLGVKVPLSELKAAYNRRFNCDLMDMPVKEPSRIDLPICVYDGENVQRVYYKERF